MKTETKHTPGPWVATTGYVAAKTTNGNRVVCSMSRTDSCMNHAAEAGSTEDGSNARLIAAAPELLEACDHVLSDLRNDASYYISEWRLNETEFGDEPDETLPAFIRGMTKMLEYLNIQVPILQAAITKALETSCTPVDDNATEKTDENVAYEIWAKFRRGAGSRKPVCLFTEDSQEKADAAVTNLSALGTYSDVWIETEVASRTAEENEVQREIERDIH